MPLGQHSRGENAPFAARRAGAAGEEIVVAKAGKPLAKLVRYEQPKEPRRLGGLEGRIWIADDFDAYDEEIARLFEVGE